MLGLDVCISRVTRVEDPSMPKLNIFVTINLYCKIFISNIFLKLLPRVHDSNINSLNEILRTKKTYMCQSTYLGMVSLLS